MEDSSLIKGPSPLPCSLEECLPRRVQIPAQVAQYMGKLRDPRVAQMLKVRAKTMVEYKQALLGLC